MDLTPLLSPIAPGFPCGLDPDVDAALGSDWMLFGESVDAQQKKWTAYLIQLAADPDSRPQPPQWTGLQKEAFDMALRTKHLQAAAVLVECLALIEGLQGLRDGLGFLLQWCSDYWTDLYPNGDADDIQISRPNCVQHLNASSVLVRLGRIPLASTFEVTKGRRHLTAGPYNLEDFEGAKDGRPDPETARLVLATFAKADQAELKASLALARESLEKARELENFFDVRDCALNLDGLRNYLARVVKALEAQVLQAAEEGAVAVDGFETASVASPGEQGTSTAIASRQGAIATLDRVIAYFETNEPSSPVPLLLRRAQRCVGKTFMEILEELDQESTGFRTILKPIDTSKPSFDE